MEETKKHNKLLLGGLFVLGFIFFIALVCYFYLGHMWVGLSFLILSIVVDVLIFIKGGKLASVFGTLSLVFVLFVSLFMAIYGFGQTKSISEEEKQSILSEKKGFVEELFQGYAEKNYDLFSKNLTDDMKKKHDKTSFLGLREELGEIISRDCSDAAKSTMGGPVVLCQIEFENAKTHWDIRFMGEEIWGLYFETLKPELGLTIMNRTTAETLPIIMNGLEQNIEVGEEDVFLIYEVELENSKDEETTLHSLSFNAGDYFFSQMIPENYSLKCKNILPRTFSPKEKVEGCVVFIITQGYEEGKIVIE